MLPNHEGEGILSIWERLKKERTMNKCCQSCKWYDDCSYCPQDGYIKGWNTSKDFCSKWEEKEKSLIDDLDDLIIDIAPKISNLQAIKAYFKQRIKQSLDTISVRGLADDQWDEIYARFSWILDQ